ncbi:MAG: DUF4434 domain-containing protein, partial [Bacteroidota bacterium]
DWYKIAFEMALERNIQVVLPGIYYTYNDQFLGGTWNPHKDLEINKKVYSELNERYGHYPNFWGWYIPHETGDRTHRGDIMVILKNLPKFLKELTPNKKVAHSPWFPSKITLGDEGLTPEETAKEWDTILNMVDGIDVFLFQDGTAPLDELEKYFAAIKPVFDKHKVELWAVLELFYRFQDGSGIELFKSISPEMLFDKMEKVSPYIKRFAIWEYQTHLYPNSKASGAEKLNNAYRNWLHSDNGETTIKIKQATPWTNLKFNDSKDKLQFIILPDRTGNERSGIFEDAIKKINLLQPEFVVSVGDLIEGYTNKEESINKQWNEVNELISKLEVPYFYVPGNHDYSNEVMARIWKEKYGKSYYHFLYKDVLFMCLNSEGEQSKLSGIDSLQYEYFEDVLKKNQNVKWTFIFMHQPIWNYNNTPYWQRLEEKLKEREYSVFAGHTHQYKKEVINNADYIILATAGGISGVRGIDYGEFDHITLVTFSENEPTVANILLDGILDENIVTDEMYNMIIADRIWIKPFFYEGNFSGGNTKLKLSNDADYLMTADIKYGDYSISGVEVQPASKEIINLPLQLLQSNSNPTTAHFAFKYDYKNNRKLNYEEKIAVAPLKKEYIHKADYLIEIDGNLKEWSELGYSFDINSPVTNEGGDNISCKFSVAYDDSNLYFAMSVYDDDIDLKSDKDIWSQNAVLINIDSNPIQISSNNRSDNIFSTEIYRLFFVPQLSEDDELKIYQKDKLPERTHLVTKKTDIGFNVELSVPIEFIDSFTDDEWQSIRLNAAYTDVDVNGKRTLIWWKPNWSSEENFIGSGIFFKN